MKKKINLFKYLKKDWKTFKRFKQDKRIKLIIMMLILLETQIQIFTFSNSNLIYDISFFIFAPIWYIFWMKIWKS